MTDSKKDEQKRDETLKRMLSTPPNPHKKGEVEEKTGGGHRSTNHEK